MLLAGTEPHGTAVPSTESSTARRRWEASFKVIVILVLLGEINNIWQWNRQLRPDRVWWHRVGWPVFDPTDVICFTALEVWSLLLAVL